MYTLGMIAPTPFFSDRGCHVRIYGQVKALKKLGNRVVLCTYHLGKDIPGIEARRIPRIPWYNKTSAGPSVHKFYLDILLFLTSARAYRAAAPDILHAYLHEGSFIADVYRRFRKLPLVVDLQGSLTDELRAHGFFSGSKTLYRFFSFLERASIKNADAILASSEMVAGVVRGSGMVNPDRVHLIPDGVDTAQFAPRENKKELREMLGLPPDRTIVVYSGLLTRYQGADILLRVAARLKRRSNDPYFVIIGFPDVEIYEKQAHDLGLSGRVRFTGRLDYREEVPLYLAASDVAVSPKISKSEANLKLLDYMAAGLPTVVFDNQVNRDCLGEDGVYADFNDEKSFAAKLGEVIDDSRGSAELGRRLRKRAEEKFSWDAIARKIMNIYAHVMSAVIISLQFDFALHLLAEAETFSEFV
ncbi:MAG: glycosyltransferase family 4 protein [Candidatus Aureabacteria bacterium]|nr:glycosyltransferase family 4 protein [Candidatus Auribacterota bacterium]